MIIEQDNYSIKILAGEASLNARDDNVDIEIVFRSGERYFATFFTLENIEHILSEYEISGERAGGTYFWASDMVIVRDLTVECIRKTIADLIRTDEISLAFSGPDGE
jgi:hypothetical protein